MGQSSDTGRRRTCTVVQFGRGGGDGECPLDVEAVDSEVESAGRCCGLVACDVRSRPEATGVTSGSADEVGGKEEPVGVSEVVDRASDDESVKVCGCLRWFCNGDESNDDEFRPD